MLIQRKFIWATLYLVVISLGLTRTITEGSHVSYQNSNPRETTFELFRRNVQKRTTTATSNETTTKKTRVHVTAIHLDKSEFPLSKLLFKSTLKLALNELNEQLEQSDVELTLSVRSANTCALQYASAIAAEEYYKRRARLFVVSGCDDAIRGVSRLASSWQVPVMTAAGFGTDLNDKTIYKTLVRVAFSLRAAVEFLFKIMRAHQWRRVNLFVDESDPNSLALSGSIEKYATEYSYDGIATTTPTTASHQFDLNRIGFDLNTLTRLDRTSVGPNETDLVSGNSTNKRNKAGVRDETLSSSQDRWPNNATEQTIRAALRQSSMFSRVSILLIPQHYLRTFMLSAYDENMANGLYTFINIPLLLDTHQPDNNNQVDHQVLTTTVTTNKQQQQSFSSTGENVFIWRSLSSSRNPQAKQAFESLMSVYLRTPTSKAYVYFSNKLVNFANLNYGATTTNGALAASDNNRIQLNINPYSASFYDCLQIYVAALNESLVQMRNKELSLTTNSTNEIDSKQMKSMIRRLYKHELHARISDLIRNRRFENMVTGTVSINSNGDRETDFTLDDMNQMTGKFQQVVLYRAETRNIERVGRIHWSSDPNVGPTSDTVDCNLLGTCVGKPLLSRSIIMIIFVTVPLAALLGGLFYFVQSKLTLESKLVDYWWRIHMSEIEVISTRRKHANDGSLVLMPTSVVGGGGDQSFVSSQLQTPSEPSKLPMNEQQQQRVAGGETSVTTMLASQKMMASTVVGDSAFGAGAGCDKTTVTRATADTTAMASSLDVCYGNIALGMYKLSKVALKPISRFHQSRKLMIELRSVSSGSSPGCEIKNGKRWQLWFEKLNDCGAK